MQETEINLIDMLFGMLRKWRKIIVFAIICAIAAGAVAAVGRVIEMNDEETVERWQAEYEVAYGTYWAEINDYDRQINENERLVAQAEAAILELDRAAEDYQDDIEDLQAKIAYYEALIVDYQANIARLGREKDKLNYYLAYRVEQNENSFLMQIDPYDVKTYESYLRVDSGYEILPGNTYQNIDRTPELLQTYRLLVSNTAFYEQMIAELKLATEVRFLTEVISVSVYNTNSLRVRVISDSESWSKTVGEYISEAIFANYDNVVQTVSKHTLAGYNTTSYSVVDLDLYAQQQAHFEEAISYENSIREIDTSILNTEADIREMTTEIRDFNTEIDDLYVAIDTIPLEMKAYEDEIASYEDAAYALRAEQLKLMEKPEPQHEGYTAFSVFTGFVKFAIIGGVVGAVVAALYFMVIGMMMGKVLSSAQLCAAVGVGYFGAWPKKDKKRFALVDRWIDRLAGVIAKDTTPESAMDLVRSNVAIACDGHSQILLCGGASAETIAAVASALKEENSDTAYPPISH